VAAARTWVEVDRAALVANARKVAAAAPGARLLPMVKADGYGLGAVEVSRALEALDPWGFGVASAEEGARLRRAGIKRPVAVFSPLDAELAECARADLTPVLGTPAQVAAWLSLAPGRAFHVELDTGMGRRGVYWRQAAALSDLLGDAPGFEGVATHFHSADSNPDSVREQWGRFQTALQALGRRPPLVHAANSAAALRHPEVAGDLVRPGIFLYGGEAGGPRPEPVVTWKATALQAMSRESGVTVGYDAAYVVSEQCALVSLAVGYADGLPRSLSNRGEVLLCGQRRPIVGTVMMDMVVVHAGSQEAGGAAAATLLGTEGAETITLDEMARAAGAISYEILTGLGGRVERRYR
jgi:alanine racemase